MDTISINFKKKLYHDYDFSVLAVHHYCQLGFRFEILKNYLKNQPIWPLSWLEPWRVQKRRK